MQAPQRVTLDGRTGWCVYMLNDGRVVPPDFAHVARVVFDDGGSGFYILDKPKVKSLKYSDDQPRVPAGSPDGGQWTDGGARAPVAGFSEGEPTYHPRREHAARAGTYAALGRHLGVDAAEARAMAEGSRRASPAFEQVMQDAARWTNGGAFKINERLVAGTGDASDGRVLEAMQALEADLPDGSLLYRGVRDGAADAVLGVQVGDQFTMRGLASATWNPGVASRFAERDAQQRNVILEIRGKRASLILPAITSHDEAEAVMPFDSKYTVRGVRELTLRTARGDKWVRLIRIDQH